MSNNRVLGIIETALFSIVEITTEARVRARPIRDLAHTGSIGEDELRERLREDPDLSAYAEAEFPPLRFYVGLQEAVALVFAEAADPIYTAEELGRYLEAS